MKKVIIYGSGVTGRKIYSKIKEETNVLGYLDNDSSRWGQDLEGMKVLGDYAYLEQNVEYDEIIIGTLTGLNVICRELEMRGVNSEKINRSFVETQVGARINFLRNYASMLSQEESFEVAEGGVFQGEFAKEINRYFPRKRLHLLDTFEGFNEKDVVVEKENRFSGFSAGHLNMTSIELVLSKLPEREMAVIHKGYFPDTAKGMENIRFGFVNLDFDLYNPILEGLRFFYPRMIRGGVILVHDYYSTGYLGVKEAIEVFEKEQGTLIKLPIGDDCSIAIYKN